MTLPRNVESSLYEVLYSEWGAVHYDKEELQRFLDRYRTLKETNTRPEELEKLEKVIELRKLDHLVRLASGDEEASKWAFREKLARTGAADLLLTNVFSDIKIQALLFCAFSNLTFNIVGSVLNLFHGFTKTSGYFRNFICSKNKEHNK